MKKIQWMVTFEGSNIRKNFDGKIPSKGRFMDLHKLWGEAFFTFYGFDEEGERKEKEKRDEFEKEKTAFEKLLGFKFDYKADSNWFIIEEIN